MPADVALWSTLAGAETLTLLTGVGRGTDGAYRAEARDRGQSVFLSSHQLAEVEAVCDRSRSGQLVETAGIAELRSSRRTIGGVSYQDTPPSLDGIPGVLGVESFPGSRLRYTLSGATPRPMLRALADADMTAVSMRGPSLAEIFLDYYGTATQ